MQILMAIPCRSRILFCKEKGRFIKTLHQLSGSNTITIKNRYHYSHQLFFVLFSKINSIRIIYIVSNLLSSISSFIRSLSWEVSSHKAESTQIWQRSLQSPSGQLPQSESSCNNTWVCETKCCSHLVPDTMELPERTVFIIRIPLVVASLFQDVLGCQFMPFRVVVPSLYSKVPKGAQAYKLFRRRRKIVQYMTFKFKKK